MPSERASSAPLFDDFTKLLGAFEQVLNELGGLAEGRGPAALQRTADAKATLQWIRHLRESQERHLAPPLKCIPTQPVCPTPDVSTTSVTLQQIDLVSGR